MAETTSDSFVCRLGACVLMAGLLVSSARSALGGDEAAAPRQPKKHRPTAAFLDLDASPLTGLLEQRLLENGRAAWLERNAIEAIRRERQLEGLADAAAGRQRVALGKLLKADLLILLRHFKEPKEHVQLVVCETKRGLRLAVHQVMLSPNVEADVQQLAALVEQAIAKNGQQVREICAVPPFVSKDLTYENEHLKAAYAKLVEQTVRDRPELLTVELEEARAIAKEVELSGGPTRRPLPLYFLGEYRHDGKREQRTAAVRMRVMRGQRKLATREASGLSPSGAADFVRRASAELIQETIGIRPLRPDPKLEAEQLAARAEAFYRLGSWSEAVALAEASLLLDDKQNRMHQVAASSLASVARNLAQILKGPDSVARGIHSYLRALKHYEIVLPTKKLNFDGSDSWKFHSHIRSSVNWGTLFGASYSPAEVKQVATELKKRELEILIRMTRARCFAQIEDEYRFLHWAVRRRPRREQFDIVLQLVPTIQHLPGADQMIYRLTLHGYAPGLLDSPEGRRYLQQLRSLDNEASRQAAVRLQDAMHRSALKEYARSKRQPEPADPVATEPPGGSAPHLRFEPVEVSYSPQGVRRAELHRVYRVVPVGSGTDLVSTSRGFHLMRQPGRLKSIRAAGIFRHLHSNVTDIDYDGRFIWIANRPARSKPRLMVIDPATEQIWEIGRQDGLPVVAPESIPDPQMYPRLLVVPLGPGRVVVVSWFGRMAICMVTFDPDRGAKVRTFYEARAKPDLADGESWRDPQVAFAPSYAVCFQGKSGDGKLLRRVLIGRRPSGEDWPLSLDPDSEEVTVLETSFPDAINPETDALTPEAVYRLVWHRSANRLVRRAFPDFRPEVLLDSVPKGRCVTYGDKLLIVGKSIWQVDPQAEGEDRMQVLAAQRLWTVDERASIGLGAQRLGAKDRDVYRLERICRSSHFGLLAIRWSLRECDLFQIVLDSP